LHFRWLKILFVIIYAPLAVEALLRMMAPVPMMPRYVTDKPYGVRGNMADMKYRHSTPEYHIWIQTNSKGIRADREIPYEKKPHIKRVVLLGDSFGMGYGVNANEMFTARMTDDLKSRFNYDVEVVNLSTSGHGNAEELIVLLNEGFKYAPDLVLLAWHYTDLEDNVRSNLFELKDGKLTRKAQSYLPGVKARNFLNRFPIYRFLTEHSQIYNLCRNWAGEKVKRWLVKSRFRWSKKRRETKSKRNRPKKQYEKELSIALLERIELECSRKNTHFMVLDIPLRISRTEFKSAFPYEYSGKTNPYPVISPIDKFKEQTGRQIYWEKGDGHFTPLGCKLVGQVLADYIGRNKLLDPQP
jgi:hypothetical protein